MAGEGHHPGEMSAGEMQELERELRALVPRSPNVELAKLMYLAGQASLSPVPPMVPSAPVPAWRAQWLWPVSTAATGTLAAWLAVLLLLANHRAALETPPTRSIVRPHPPVAAPTVPDAPPPAPRFSAAEAPRATITAAEAVYLRDRDKALAAGVEALAPPPVAADLGPRALAGRALQSRELPREFQIQRTRGSMWNWLGR